MTITTERLILRSWKPVDRKPFARMSIDDQVMRFLLPLPTRDCSDVWIDRQTAHMSEHGFCSWAVEARGNGAFVGSVGLFRSRHHASFTSAVEVGWRIAREFWGRGYASEAAAASVRLGFKRHGLDEILASTCAENSKSRRVMVKLGMTHDPADDFEHPLLSTGHPLRHQVHYRLTRSRWRDMEEASAAAASACRRDGPRRVIKGVDSSVALYP